MSEYYIQKRELSDGTWHRLQEEPFFALPIDALERADEIRSRFPNDGLPHAVRVVSSQGVICQWRPADRTN